MVTTTAKSSKIRPIVTVDDLEEESRCALEEEEPKWRTEMTVALSRALEATDAELFERVFDGLLQLIIDYTGFRTCHGMSGATSVATKVRSFKRTKQ